MTFPSQKSFVPSLFAILLSTTFGLVAGLEVADAANSFGNILFVGDSITVGWSDRVPAGDGDYSWRYAFWKNLVDGGDSFQFVGSRTSNYPTPTSYPTYSGLTFPNRHEAGWGTSSTERLNSLTSLVGSHWSDLNGDNSDFAADTAFLFVGGNDFATSTPPPSTLKGVSDRLGLMVDRLQAANASVDVYLLGITPRFVAPDTNYDGFLDTPDGRNDDYATINAALAGFEATKSTATSNVRYVDLFNLIRPTMLYDGVHPNGFGEAVIANVVYAAASVPEPSSLLLLGVAGLGFVATRRRKR